MDLLKNRIATLEKEIMEKHSTNFSLLERSYFVININKKSKRNHKATKSQKLRKSTEKEKNLPSSSTGKETFLSLVIQCEQESWEECK